MAKEEGNRLLSKVAKFVRNPLKDWSELDGPEAGAAAPDTGYSREVLKEMIERRQRNDFVRRRDSFRRAYDLQCVQPADAAGQDVVDINACGLELRGRYGFPDAQCPDESPMAELDGEILAIPQPAPDLPLVEDAGDAPR